MEDITTGNDEYFNPKRKFRSVEEAGNFMEKEWNDEKFRKRLDGLYLPINNVDPRYNHNQLIKTLQKIPQSTTTHKRYIKLLMTIIVAATDDAIKHRPSSPELVKQRVAHAIGVPVEELKQEEQRAMDYVRSYLSKNDLGTVGDQ